MNAKRSFASFPLLALSSICLLSGCGEGESQATSIESIESISIYAPEADEVKFSDFSLSYFPEKGGYMVGDYKGNATAIVVPDEATGEDGLTAPIVGLSDYAFYGRKGLTTVVLGKNLRYIGDYAFANSDVTDLRVDLGLGDVATKAFADSDVRFYQWNGTRYLPGLDNPYFLAFFRVGVDITTLSPQTKSLLIPKTMTKIDRTHFRKTLEEDAHNYYYAPEMLAKLEGIGLPDGMTEIGRAAFSACTSLKQITLPNTLETVGDYAFDSCSSLSSIVLPDSVTKVKWNAFSGCRALESVVFSPNITSIGNEAFTGCAMKSIDLPEGIISLGDSAFAGCTNLESARIPSTLTTLGANVFKNCSPSLFHEYEGMNYVGPEDKPYYCLTGKAGETPEVFHIHPDCELVPNEACKLDDTTQEVVVPEGCRLVFRALYGSGVRKITFLGVPGRVDDDMVQYCGSPYFATYNEARYLGNDENPYMVLYDVPNKSVKGLAIHPDCNLIGGNAFRMCHSLKSIVIPSKVQRICLDAFGTLNSLGSVVIENAPVVLEERAFDNDDSLTSVSLGNAVVSIGANAFRDCDALTSIAIPASCQTLGDSAFSSCNALSNIQMDAKPLRIPAYCFNGAAITSFGIPSSVVEIGDYAFSACKKLTVLYIPESVETVQSHAFSNCDALTDVYVEAASKPRGWKCSFGTATVHYGYQLSEA